MRARRAIAINVEKLGLDHKKGHSVHTLSGRGPVVVPVVETVTVPPVVEAQLELKMTPSAPPPPVVEEVIAPAPVVEPTPEPVPVVAEVVAEPVVVTTEPAVEPAPVAETVIEEESAPASTTEVDAEGKPSKKRGKKAAATE